MEVGDALKICFLYLRLRQPRSRYLADDITNTRRRAVVRSRPADSARVRPLDRSCSLVTPNYGARTLSGSRMREHRAPAPPPNAEETSVVAAAASATPPPPPHPLPYEFRFASLQRTESGCRRHRRRRRHRCCYYYSSLVRPAVFECDGCHFVFSRSDVRLLFLVFSFIRFCPVLFSCAFSYFVRYVTLFVLVARVVVV